MPVHGLLTSALLAAATATAGAAPQQAPSAWQQGVSYRIEASLDEPSHVLTGRARVWYRNESPDTLHEFYLHLYLNAFRPNSAWARRDLQMGIHTFQDLGPDDWAFDRLEGVEVDGRPVSLVYPYAPDSTIVRMELPAPLPPGAEITLAYDWNARLSTTFRRQGRKGRHYDFAQWYPKVVVYDLEGWRAHPLYRMGEFYGEFATFDVTLDLPADQVVGATGVPVEGDPGWAGAAASGTGPVDLQRSWYGPLDSLVKAPCVVRGGVRSCDVTPREALPTGASLGLLSPTPAPGRKRVRWYARDVHHFAWSTDPAYIYEQGHFRDAAIHVLYRPGDQRTWGNGKAVRNTVEALRWLDGLYGKYGYPQITNLHRLEGGGTEFPMMVMDGSASLGLILHEVGHQYSYAMLGNNEWYEGWLDEGMTSFQTAWYEEEHGLGRRAWVGSEARVMDLDLRGKSEPVTFQAERYSDFPTYDRMIYTKGEIILWMLREMAGKERMRQIMRTWYRRYQFRHVDQYSFQSVAEEVMHRDLDWFFGEWLHTTGVTDYALGDVHVRRDGSGWLTTLEIDRRGNMRMPVPVYLEAKGQVKDTVVPGDALRWTHHVYTSFKPRRIALDPLRTTLDWNATNDVWRPGLFGRWPYLTRLDDPLGALPRFIDRAPLRLFPLAWANNAGGVVAGFQARTSYLGNTRQALVRFGFPGVNAFRKGGLSRRRDVGSLYVRVENPILWGRPRYGMRIETFIGEGRSFLDLSGERDVSRRPLLGPRTYVRAGLTLSSVYDPAYLVPGRWTLANRGAAEVSLGMRQTRTRARWDLGLSWGLDSNDHFFTRGTFTQDVTTAPTRPWRANLRFFAGAVLGRYRGIWSGAEAPRERQLFVAGGDPYAALSDPWVRSTGAPLEFHGWVPGGGQLEGYHPGLALGQLASLTGRLATPAVGMRVRSARLRARASVFGGLAMGATPTLADGPRILTPAAFAGLGGWGHVYASAGVGGELAVAGSPLSLRVDLPLVVADPDLAATERTRRFAFRYAISVRTGR
ncbi:MAG: M1 family metallopeptidase [Gemmatimonadetes bacterium]|nr:M1 family metallopeptidase [Gemmatimonadota bacterium]